MASFSEAELTYLATQRLGRLATVAPDGSPQNSPTGFRYNPKFDTIDIGGLHLGTTRKFRNIQKNNRVAFVIDDIPSLDPYRVRCVEIRGTAEALTDQPLLRPGLSPELIRIHPTRVISFGITEPAPRSTTQS